MIAIDTRRFAPRLACCAGRPIVTVQSGIQFFLFVAVVLLLVRPVGSYLVRVFGDGSTLLDPVLVPLERRVYRLAGVDPAEDMSARAYTVAFLLFSLAGTVILYAVLRLQQFCPWYDKSVLTTPMTPDLAMNTAISFSTTSTWQAYGGESTMSYWTQIVGLAGQNFLAGASGMAIGIAFIRGLAGRETRNLGNFWRDLVRSILWVLLPTSVVGSLILVWQGVPMNFLPYIHATTLEGQGQIIAQGPVAALEFIKNLGTNGGGFFNVNGAHPFENPTALTNFLEMLAIAVLPASLTYTFGVMVGNPRQGWMLLAVMTFLFVAGYIACVVPEQHGNRQFGAAVNASTAGQSGGNMEGKEVRFGIGGSVLTTVVASNGATGSTNSMLDSYMPLSGMIPIVNMLLGEIVYGGLGTGIYSIVIVALIALFVAGLMVGRTPEYLGKQIGASDMKLVMLYTLASPLAILLPTAAALTCSQGLAGPSNTGPHGLSEILTAYTSSFANNGESFGGLNADTPFYNISTAFAMVAGRFFLAIPALALAGRFASKKQRTSTLGTLRTDSLQFAVLLTFTAIVVVGLGFFPALALGPIVEHLLMAH